MQLDFTKALKHLFDESTHSPTNLQWERDWKSVSSLHILLPENRDERLCSLFLRLSSMFEAGIFFQETQHGWQQVLRFNRGEIKPAVEDLYTIKGIPQHLNKVEKTDSEKWKELFSQFFKDELSLVSVYRVPISKNAFILLADRLPDPWMKSLMAEALERILRGIA